MSCSAAPASSWAIDSIDYTRTPSVTQWVSAGPALRYHWPMTNFEEPANNEEFEWSEAERLRFMAKPSSFAPSQSTAEDSALLRILFASIFIAAYFSFFAAGFGIAVHNFYLISAEAASASNWVFALIGVLMVWISSLR